MVDRPVLALVMAGGEGRGLSVLSERRAKPAAPIAGGYRLIDFALSNLANSGLTRIAVITQYLPHSLFQHIGDGAPWDLARRPPNGVRFWQPYRSRGEEGWYGGTADALYQNRSRIAESGAELVLIVCGDHVYRQDYRDMIVFHRERGRLTIAVTPVRHEDTHRFGIATVDGEKRITSFVEKPAATTSTLASMGIYVFDTDLLLRRLEEDARDPASTHEVGRDIIPKMIVEDDVFAYPFTDPWTDVGTVSAYFGVNRAFLDERPPVDVHDRDWPIRTRIETRPAAYLGRASEVRGSLVSAGCVIEGSVIRSVLSPGVRVAPGAVVRDAIVLHDCVVGTGAIVDRCVLDRDVEVGAGARVGVGPVDHAGDRGPELSDGITLAGMGAQIPAGAFVGRNCVIASDVEEADFERLEVPTGVSVKRR